MQSEAALRYDIVKTRKDFPILSREVNGYPLVYFDNAATTQKPKSVIDALTDYYSNYNSSLSLSLCIFFLRPSLLFLSVFLPFRPSTSHFSTFHFHIFLPTLVRLSVCLFVYLYVHVCLLSFFLSICMSVFLSVPI